MPEAALGGARADSGGFGRATPRARIARLQATHGNAAVVRALARQEAGDATPAQAARDGLEPEHLASADRREPEIDQGPVAQRALASAQRAMGSAVRSWQGAASLVGVIVSGVTAFGGTLIGPPLAPSMIGTMVADGAEPEVASAFANAASSSWLTWSATVKVPGIPWYPSFAAVPSAVATPTPNIPSPVVQLTNVGAVLSSGVVAMQTMGLLGARSADPAWRQAASAFGAWVERNFFVWQAATMVTNVLGTGPVPTYAPPFVPIGPVVGGVANMIPGGFVGPPFGMV